MHMPKVGLGTYPIKEVEVFEQAIKLGYRHIDTATMYNNEAQIGEAIKTCLEESVCTRQDLFVVTKLWHTDYADPEAALKLSLSKLQLAYVDCYLIHWPNNLEAKKPFHVIWAEMESLVTKGLTRSIGVSNFGVQLLSDLLCYAKIKPVCN
jgi:diketogulonate reductase-like aldo/keto reductase